MKFSERIGKTSVRESLQVEAVDDDLQSSLWNLLHSFYLEHLQHKTVSNPEAIKRFVKSLWSDFLKIPLDSIPVRRSELIKFVKDWFFRAEWYEAYDVIEFVAQYDRYYDNQGFETACNDVLKREMSGYRLLDGVVVQITSETELAEIESAIQNSRKTALSGVNEHLRTALAKIADRKKPDYRNSIKESISAVESISMIISGDPNASLGQALKVVEDEVGLHPALKRGFSAIYGYTSNEEGIRHALLESGNCDFEDAKYMLVSCSAFVNYLIVKANKAGVKLN